MKKFLTSTLATALLLMCGLSFADTVRITNGSGQTFNADLSSITYSEASGWSMKSDSNLTLGGSNPGPTPDPDDGDTCASGSVVCAYPIGEWAPHSGEVIEVPKGATISSRFVTSASRGRFDMVPSLYDGYPAYSMWVSDQPGGDTFTSRTGATASSSECGLVTSNLAFNLLWITSNTNGRYCELQSNKTYYINIRHGNSSVDTSNITRRLK